jgi:serine/threonine-protein kinase
MGRVAIPGHSFGPAANAEPEGTVVGMARVPMPSIDDVRVTSPGFGGGPPSEEELDAFSEVGGTVVGMSRVAAPAASAGPAADTDAGGTVVGMGRVMAPAGFPARADDPDTGGTVVSMPVASMRGAPAPSAPAAFPRPSGPPPAYEIIRHLGGGDLGQVFHARHRENGAEVAMRIVRPDIVTVGGAVEALRDVVALAQGAEHTHLGRQYELDETASPTIVVEYVPGRQLSSIMSERGAAPAAAVIDLGVRLCSALAAAHAAGLAHGRVHAGNVMLEAKTGRWVLLDLGHGYALQGLEPAHDLYALGALLYEMATGHGPFENGETALDPRTYVPTLPPTLSALLLRTLAPDPAVWFGSAAELVQALARARGHA